MSLSCADSSSRQNADLVRFRTGTQSASILLPVLLDLVAPTSPATSARSIATNHLVSLATTCPSHFKEATAALESEQRSLLEDSIRTALGQGSKRNPATAGHAAEEAPRISLKMFG